LRLAAPTDATSRKNSLGIATLSTMKRCQTCNTLGGDNQSACYSDGQPLVEDPLATTLQEAIGEKYSLTKLIGKGAMGAVYRAHHRDLGDVAIKVMLGRGDNQTLSERFLREARALRKLRHQNAVLIYDLDRSPAGVTYMVMEMVAGRSLGEDLRERKRLTLDETMEVAEAVCSALAAAHERGIIHRDLKPDNILRAEEQGLDGRTIRTIKIADFGIVKQRPTGDEGSGLQLTKFGKPIGTPFYMSPEQWFGDLAGEGALDHRADIYALGCTLYELLAGRPPFVARTTEEMRQQHLREEPPPLHNVASHVPLPVSRVIMRSLAKDRDERQQTATEFFNELRAAYNESFQSTGEKVEERLRSTQEAWTDEAAAEEPQAILIDTAEAVPMFSEKVLAIAPVQPPVEPSHEADAFVPEFVASTDAGEPSEPPEASADAEQEPSYNSIVARANLALEHESPSARPVAAVNSRRRRALVIASALLLVSSIIIIGLVVYLYRHRAQPVATENVAPPQEVKFKPPQLPMSALVGTLAVKAAPGSEVFVDDERAGTTGADGLLQLQAPVGQRSVRVAAKNFRLWIKTDARVKANQKTTVSAARERPVEVEEATTEEHERRADEAYKKKDYDTAEAEYRELLKIAPEEAARHARLGAILNQQQRYAEAIEELGTAARLDPKDTDTRGALVKLYLLKWRDAEAEATARQLLKLAPNEANSHYLLARALLRDSGKLDEAASEIDAALKSKETPQFLETKAYVLLAQGALDEALTTAQRAAELDRNKASSARAAVAVILFRMERVDEAVNAYRDLRQADKLDRWGDSKWLELQRTHSKPALETLAALIARTN
jgi:eukaryotic-like serine/threonine-protein kinase